VNAHAAEIHVEVAPELALFVPQERRRGASPLATDGVSTLGHVVESLGVPLTEVGELVVDGRPVPTGWLPPELRERATVGRVRGADVTWRRVAAPAGPGYFMVGDAAAVLDPASSHGVLKAFMSGIMAGHAVARASSGALPWPAALAGYSEWVRRWFEHDAAELRERYRRFPRFAR